MTKTVFKEIIIILLLLLAIILVLGIFLYDYIPTNKIVPKIEQYEAPDNIKEELKATVNDEENTETQIVYEIDATDLKKYEKSKDYEKGKVNPFSQDTIGSGTVQTGTNVDTTNSDSTNIEEKPTTNSNSVGNYLPNTGTK